MSSDPKKNTPKVTEKASPIKKVGEKKAPPSATSSKLQPVSSHSSSGEDVKNSKSSLSEKSALVPLRRVNSGPPSPPSKEVIKTNTLQLITHTEKELKALQETIQSIKPVDLRVLALQTKTIPDVYHKLKVSKVKIKKYVEMTNDRLKPLMKEKNELQLDVESLIMFRAQEREFSNVLSMYNRTTSTNLTFESSLKFKNTLNGIEVPYDEKLSESALAYLEDDLAAKMSIVQSLSKLRKDFVERYRILNSSLRDIKYWATRNGIVYKRKGEKEEEVDEAT